MHNIGCKRLLAGLIDFFVLCIVSAYGAYILVLGQTEKYNVLSVIIYLIIFAMLILFKDDMLKGQSIGKRIMKIRVDWCGKATMKRRIKRAMPLIIYPVEIILLLTTNARLGDRWSRSTVSSI